MKVMDLVQEDKLIFANSIRFLNRKQIKAMLFLFEGQIDAATLGIRCEVQI